MYHFLQSLKLTLMIALMVTLMNFIEYKMEIEPSWVLGLPYVFVMIIALAVFAFGGNFYTVLKMLGLVGLVEFALFQFTGEPVLRTLSNGTLAFTLIVWFAMEVAKESKRQYIRNDYTVSELFVVMLAINAMGLILYAFLKTDAWGILLFIGVVDIYSIYHLGVLSQLPIAGKKE